MPSASGKVFTKFSPFDDRELAQVTNGDAMDFIKVLQVSKKTATTFKNSAFADRASALEKMAQHLQANAANIAFQEALHQGLSAAFVNDVSVSYSVGLLQKIAAQLQTFAPSTQIPQAVGVVGIITSWCCSLRLVMERMAPAIAAGNVVIVKVSEHSPITAQIIGESVLASGLPAGVVQILQGGAELGELIASHPGVRAIAATGKPSTMEAIAKSATAQLKKTQLSGGAKNAGIVLADFDFENHMADIFRPFLIGQGQLCWNTSRLFIPEATAAQFMAKAEEFINNLTPLQNPEGTEMWTPLIEKSRVPRIQADAQTAISEHGKLKAGGEASAKGAFLRPQLVLDLPQCSVFQQDETSGPLILVTPVKYQHEAVKWTNTSYLGHSAVVWGSYEKALKVAPQLEVAYVSINQWMTATTPPIFGLKQSTFGNPDTRWDGTFYSDVKLLAAAP